MNQREPQEDAFTPADDAIARHREELKKRFPMPSPSKPEPRSRTRLGVAMAVLGFACGLIWLDPAYRTEQFSSAIGKYESIQLADGSHVTLDAASRIRVSWHLRSRQVELQQGQALFSVAPAVYRPFLTIAGATRITVVGTRYNVNRSQQDVRVTVEEGRVDVGGSEADIRLHAGDQVLVRNGRLGMPVRIDASASSAWTNGRLVFDRTPLREVLEVVQRHRAGSVIIQDQSLNELPVSGAFDSNRLDGMLALLPKILPVELSRDADGTLYLNRRASRK